MQTMSKKVIRTSIVFDMDTDEFINDEPMTD
jgi:hypothetical protein